MIKNRFFKRSDGFTTVELITVLIIVSLLSAYVVNTSMALVDQSDHISHIKQIEFHLKYAQVKSMNSAGFWGIDFSGTGYSLFSWEESNPGKMNSERFPDEQSHVVPKPDDTYQTTTEYIWFDNLGRAYISSAFDASVIHLTDISVAANIVSKGGTQVLSLQPETGYVTCNFK